jgi:6-phosphogluconolactonase
MKTAPLLAFGCLLSITSPSTMPAAEGRERIYFGTYGQAANEGVFVAELDLTTGHVSEPRLVGRAVNASFVALHPDHRHLYAVAEVSSLGGRRTGGVVAFSIAPETGALHQINEQPSGGAGPCHLVVDKAGKNVIVANYEGGSVAVLPIDERGGLKRASSIQLHHGKGVNRERQEAAHAHSVNLDPANRFAFVADLGVDKIFVYRFDAAAGKLSPNQPPAVKVAAGAGPRHFAFDPTGRFAYVIDELDSTITAFWYDAENGTLSRIQVVSTLPKDFHGENTASEVAVHPSGKFVYGANRGHDSLAIFSVDPVSGKLTADGHEPTQGKTPRNFAIDPTGAFLLAANQDSDSVVVFRIDAATGRLRATGQKLRIHQPVCVRSLVLKGS